MGQTPYILQMNVERYQALLKDPETTGERRRTIEQLLREAQAKLASIPPDEPDSKR